MNEQANNLAAALRMTLDALDCMPRQRDPILRLLIRIAIEAGEAAMAADDVRAILAADIPATPPEPVRIVVKLEGGLVQWIGTDSSQPIHVAVIDYDTEGADDDEVTEIPQDDGGTEDAVARIESADSSSPAFIAAAFAAITEAETP